VVIAITVQISTLFCAIRYYFWSNNNTNLRVCLEMMNFRLSLCCGLPSTPRRWNPTPECRRQRRTFPCRTLVKAGELDAVAGVTAEMAVRAGVSDNHTWQQLCWCCDAGCGAALSQLPTLVMCDSPKPSRLDSCTPVYSDVLVWRRVSVSVILCFFRQF